MFCKTLPKNQEASARPASIPVPNLLLFLALALPIFLVPAATAQEKPYFVTYSHDLEEPGNLDIETKTALAQPDGSTQYGATALELEYGVLGWWTSELYLDGQATSQDSTIFTGFRIENRFRLLMRDHAVNPVLYVEYENISGADKTILEVVGHDSQSDLAGPNGNARREHQHEAELKLILSSNIKDWNISENFISEKNLGHEPWEFGYAVGVARPLRGAAADTPAPSARKSSSPALKPTAASETPPPSPSAIPRTTSRPSSAGNSPRACASAFHLASASLPPAWPASTASASPTSSIRSATGSTPPNVP